MPIRVSAKYWAEHVGLPYHQSAIRELELPHSDPGLDPFSALSMGARNHTRYGYADFLEEGRPYGFMFRVFPGTHKFLLWGDPLTAAAHARAFRFCDSDGAELLEPLAFKGRRGSGIPGSRCAYRDPAANPAPDWSKYLYTYVLWGRLLYNPGCDPEVWRRVLRSRFGERARPLESALGLATRILPVITTAHTPSAAQDTYSPEFYTNQSIAEPAAPAPYGDTPSPKVFGTVSPLDPQLFSTIEEYAGRLLARDLGAKYSPVEVAQWIEDLADAAAAHLAEADPPPASTPGSENRPRGVRHPHPDRARPLLRGEVPERRPLRRLREVGLAPCPRRIARPVPAGEKPLGSDVGGSRTRLRRRHHLRSPAASAGALDRPAAGNRCRHRGHGAGTREGSGRHGRHRTRAGGHR